MIPRIHNRAVSPSEPLAEALGRPVSDQEGLTEYTVVAHWPGLDSYTPDDDEQKTWTSAEWAAHLDDPTWQHPLAASVQDDRPAIWHADVRLHPRDRTLTGPEWSEIAHRLARTAGIHTPDDHGCRWIAVQSQPGRLDLLANLIRPNDTWTRQPHRLGQLLMDECRRIEADLGLIPPRPGPNPAQAAARFAARRTATDNEPLEKSTADAATQLARLLRQLADENTGPLSTVRGMVEHAAYRLDRLPHAYGPAAGHQLKLIARRLHGIQQDLDATAASLPTATQTPPPATWQTPAPAAGRASLNR